MDIRSLALVAATSAAFGFGGAYAAVAINSPSAGERGPAGPAGPQGVTGPQGPAGEPVSLGPGLGTTDDLATVLGNLIRRQDEQAAELRQVGSSPRACTPAFVVVNRGGLIFDTADLSTQYACLQSP